MRSVWFLLVGFLVAYHCIDYASAKSSTDPAPTFSQCKPYVDAALKGGEPAEEEPTSDADEDSDESGQDSPGEPAPNNDDNDSKEDDSKSDEAPSAENEEESNEDEVKAEESHDDDSKEEDDSKENHVNKDDNETKEQESESNEDSQEAQAEQPTESTDGSDDDSKEAENNKETESQEAQQQEATSDESGEDSKEDESNASAPADSDTVAHDSDQSDSQESTEEQKDQENSVEAADAESTESTPAVEDSKEDDSKEDAKNEVESAEDSKEQDAAEAAQDSKEDGDNSTESDEDNSEEAQDSQENVESYVPRSRQNLEQILGLDDSAPTKQLESLLDKATQTTLKDLKTIYETAIKPLEATYKYRDLSNRHFGDPEIFSKPLVVFMGPWSGGKSTIINWLSGIENHDAALRTGADPSPAQFNILTHGKEDEVLDGTQLAADWTFSGLQKFGQTFLDRLRGRRLPNRLLEKINLVEIPGILEVRKQVERSFPFNDACQWFIDRADVLFLVYDPAKLDIGPETEAILDQLKGRESQIRIVLNKADSVKPDELLRLQANLIWNISPLMASAEPPTLYIASLWGRPLNPDSPTSILLAHENNFLKDIREATERRVETRIAAARRFAVRVRNHAKMCDCYLNTYNNHRSFFSNKKKISDDIIEHPQNYHIYEGLSTLRNISRYDLPDPDTYKDFFRLNPLWEFPTLASTCTYFRGCPINKLDIAIAYDLPELLGKYRRQREAIISAPAQQAQPGKSGKKN